MSLSLKDTRKEGSMGDMCYSTAGHGNGREGGMPWENGYGGHQERKVGHILDPKKDENSSIWEPACSKIF